MVKSAGSKLGLDYSHKCRRVPNTLQAHTLIDWAGEETIDKQNAVAEILFRQYHTDGLYPDEEALVNASMEAGLDAESARAAITNKEKLDAVALEIRNNARVGGVPYFIVNGKGAFSGAQPPATFLKAFDQA